MLTNLNLRLIFKYYCNIISMSSSCISCFIPGFRINNIDFYVMSRKQKIYKISYLYKKYISYMMT